MPRPSYITEADKERMRELRNAGMTYAQIGQILSTTRASVYYWLNPNSQQRKREYNKARSAAVRTKVKATRRVPKPSSEQLPPPDTRALVARIMGDPLPGRSALDMKRDEAAMKKDQLNAFDSTRSRYNISPKAKDRNEKGSPC
jgi:hypothetical protein